MNLIPIKESRYDEWDRFVAKANGTIFHTAWWYTAWGVDFEIYARTDEKGEIQAGMPVHISHFKGLPKMFGVKGLTRPPLTLVNGPIFIDTAKKARCSRYSHEKKEVMTAIGSLPRADFYDILLHSFNEDLMPYIWNGFDSQVYYTYVIAKDESGAWQGRMSPAARSELRKAQKGAEAEKRSIETEAPLEEMMPLFFETAQMKGFSSNLGGISSLMPSWWDAVMMRKSGRSYILRDSTGRAMCASLAVWDSRTMYYLVGGMNGEARLKNLNMLLFERMITDSFGMGLDFDFEGSTLKGVEEFIRRWGGELRPCFRVTKFPSLPAYLGMKIYRYLKFHRKRQWE